jgi:hypothetical protein
MMRITLVILPFTPCSLKIVVDKVGKVYLPNFNQNDQCFDDNYYKIEYLLLE